jgi:initiation factor 1A
MENSKTQLTPSREVKIGVEERTKTTTRSANSHSKKKAKVGAVPHPSHPHPTTCHSTHTFPTEYAQVIKMLGNGRLEALCFDGEKRLAHIRGKLRKKVWINQGDIILLSLRDYQDEKGDVILKYSADEARSLKAYGELPESAKINETDTYVFLLLCGACGKGRWLTAL